jgi:hypothetical protein
MYKRSVFTTVTPLPSYVHRDTVVEGLHSHGDMIKLNPLVVKYERCDSPRHAPVDEFYCVWYELTDKIRYLPGISGKVSYKACFHDLPTGLQTHVYAPTGLDIQEKWSVGGSMPGEPRQPIELGLTNVPREGLYLREDVNMRCSVFASDFVKKTLRRAHETLVQRLVVRADLLRRRKEDYMDTTTTTSTVPSSRSSPSFYGGSVIDTYDRADSYYQSGNLIGFRRDQYNTPATTSLQPFPRVQVDTDIIPPPLRPAPHHSYNHREMTDYLRPWTVRQYESIQELE